MSNPVVSSSSPATSAPAPIPQVRKDRVRVIGLMAKKPGMTDDEFYTYWREVHGPLFANMEITKKNILKYEQVQLASSVADLSHTRSLISRL